MLKSISIHHHKLYFEMADKGLAMLHGSGSGHLFLQRGVGSLGIFDAFLLKYWKPRRWSCCLHVSFVLPEVTSSVAAFDSILAKGVAPWSGGWFLRQERKLRDWLVEWSELNVIIKRNFWIILVEKENSNPHILQLLLGEFALLC